MEIQYNIDDWHDEYQSSQEKPASFDEAVDLMQESSIGMGKLAMLLIVGREKGQVNDERMPSNKLANLTGVAKALGSYRYNQVIKARVGKDQHEVSIPAYVAHATVDDGQRAEFEFTLPLAQSETTIVKSTDDAAIERCISYLFSQVTGRIRERLTIIAATKPPLVSSVANELKDAIDDIVEELS